ncbi:MAG: HHL1-like protein [Cyanobacteria bacterium J06555_12]
MSEPKGFGKKTPKKPKSARTAKREKASKQYDKMKTDGLPEYEVYVRGTGSKQWYPIGRAGNAVWVAGGALIQHCGPN